MKPIKARILLNKGCLLAVVTVCVAVAGFYSSLPFILSEVTLGQVTNYTYHRLFCQNFWLFFTTFGCFPKLQPQHNLWIVFSRLSLSTPLYFIPTLSFQVYWFLYVLRLLHEQPAAGIPLNIGDRGGPFCAVCGCHSNLHHPDLHSQTQRQVCNTFSTLSGVDSRLCNHKSPISTKSQPDTI